MWGLVPSHLYHSYHLILPLLPSYHHLLHVRWKEFSHCYYHAQILIYWNFYPCGTIVLIVCMTQYVQWQTNAIALKLIVEWICSFLDNYEASSGNSLPTFWDNLSLLSSRVKNPRRVSWILDPWRWEWLVVLKCLRNYHYSLHNNPYERWSHLLHGRSLKSHITIEWVSDQSFMCMMDLTALLICKFLDVSNSSNWNFKVTEFLYCKKS